MRIEVDIKKVKSANHSFATSSAIVEEVVKNLNLLKWRIPKDALDRRNVKVRLDMVSVELNRIQQDIEEIYKVVNASMDRYEEADNKTVKSQNEIEFL